MSASITLTNVALEAALPQLQPWVSWRTYRVTDQPNRTFLLNQLSGEFLLLEGSASAYWAALCDRPASLSGMETVLGLTPDELAEFAQELAQAGLVRLTRDEEPKQCEPSPPGQSEAEIVVNLEREMMAWAAQNGFVYAAHWEVTYRCNELCVHCYNPGAAHTIEETPHRARNELTTNEAKQLLDDLVDLGVFRLTLSGGEATLRKDFVELLAYARQLGFQVVIYTNALKMSQAFLATIASLYPASVEISIYGADSAQHDAVTRVPGSFVKSMNNLAHFRRHHIHTTFKSSLMKSNIAGWQSTMSLGQDSADTVILNSMISQGTDGKLAPLNTAAEFGQLVVLAATPGSPIDVGGEKQNWGRADLPAHSQKPCGAGHGSIAITPEGEIYPCIAFPLSIGNFRIKGLHHLKRLPPSAPSELPPSFTAEDPGVLLDQWRSIRMESMIDCGKHERCYYCGDLCPGDAFVQTGNPLRAAENHCRQASARMTAGQHLQAGYSQDDLRQKFGVSTEFGRELGKTRPTIRLHPVR